MKFAFFGSPEFAAMVLKDLLEAGLVPDMLICNPDRPVGRKKLITPPATKQLIRDRGLLGQVKIFQPDKTSDLIPQLTDIEADFFVVAAYAKIIPQSVLNIPRLGTIGVHPSLLPKYRGASPIQSALLEGENITGITLYLLQAGVDDGPILAQSKEQIEENDNFETLMPKLGELGGKMLSGLIPEFMAGKIVPKPQDDSAATFTRKFASEDGFIAEADLQDAQNENEEKARRIHNLIRALGSEPGVWTLKGEDRIKLLASELSEARLQLTRIHRAGKNAEDFSGRL